jgi:hypothetical protein
VAGDHPLRQRQPDWYEPNDAADYADSWSAGLFLRFPLFTGFDLPFRVREASERAEQARVLASQREQLVVLEVWTAYVDLKTAAERVKSARDLLASAEQSERVALARYREGVGIILDSLAAQAALAEAEVISARRLVRGAARLARATGTLRRSRPAGTGEVVRDAIPDDSRLAWLWASAAPRACTPWVPPAGPRWWSPPHRSSPHGSRRAPGGGASSLRAGRVGRGSAGSWSGSGFGRREWSRARSCS